MGKIIASLVNIKNRLVRMWSEPSTYAGLGGAITSYSALKYPFNVIGIVGGLIAMYLADGKSGG